jgi:hypothetical protein
VDGAAGSYNETCVTCDVDGTEEAIDRNDEMPEAISYPSIKTEYDVSFRVVCEVVLAHAFRPFIAPKIVKLLLFILCLVHYFE